MGFDRNAKNVHVKMMKRLREKYNENRVSGSWLSRIVNYDSDNRVINLRNRHYTLQDLESRGITCNDFLLDRISWGTMRRLGYTLPEASYLGFTTDDLLALSISNDDLLREDNMW